MSYSCNKGTEWENGEKATQRGLTKSPICGSLNISFRCPSERLISAQVYHPSRTPNFNGRKGVWRVLRGSLSTKALSTYIIFFLIQRPPIAFFESYFFQAWNFLIPFFFLFFITKIKLIKNIDSRILIIWGYWETIIGCGDHAFPFNFLWRKSLKWLKLLIPEKWNR